MYSIFESLTETNYPFLLRLLLLRTTGKELARQTSDQPSAIVLLQIALAGQLLEIN